MGIGPRSVQPGDLVVHLRGGWYPFILRKVMHDDYRLQGEAYVHEIIDVDAVEAERIPESVFHIR
jgi:hypothetical protein